MIVEKQILIVNELITTPKNLKIRYNIEEDGFYRLLTLRKYIRTAQLSLRKNNRLEGVFSLNAMLDNGTAHNHPNFSLYQNANGSTNMPKIFSNRERRQELGIIQLKKGLLTGVLLLDFPIGGIGTPDSRFQLILQKVRFEEEDKAQ